MPDTGNHLAEIIAGADYNVIMDGADKGSQAYSWDVGDTLTLGKVQNGSLTGYISEVLIYNTALNATDRQKVETYLSAKYNIH